MLKVTWHPTLASCLDSPVLLDVLELLEVPERVDSPSDFDLPMFTDLPFFSDLLLDFDSPVLVELPVFVELPVDDAFPVFVADLLDDDEELLELALLRELVPELTPFLSKFPMALDIESRVAAGAAGCGGVVVGAGCGVRAR